jgi:putative oxidoreductase
MPQPKWPLTQNLGVLLVRLAYGTIFAVHGWQKVTSGVAELAPFVEKLGFPLPHFFAWCAALAELLGGLSVGLGLYGRAGAFFVAVNMAVAVFMVHFSNGLTGQGGFEYPLTLLALSLFFILAGTGPWSVDRLWARKGWFK